jgi:hypothetical protein
LDRIEIYMRVSWFRKIRTIMRGLLIVIKYTVFMHENRLHLSHLHRWGIRGILMNRKLSLICAVAVGISGWSPSLRMRNRRRRRLRPRRRRRSRYRWYGGGQPAHGDACRSGSAGGGAG